MNILKYIFFWTVLLFLPKTQAHDAGGTLPPAPSGSDMWLVTCPSDEAPDNLEVELSNNTANGPMVSLQVITGESPPRWFNISDPIGGDNKFFNKIDTDYGGDHYILVNKNAAGIAVYHFTYHCQSNGTHTPSTYIQKIQ